MKQSKNKERKLDKGKGKVFREGQTKYIITKQRTWDSFGSIAEIVQ